MKNSHCLARSVGVTAVQKINITHLILMINTLNSYHNSWKNYFSLIVISHSNFKMHQNEDLKKMLLN